jgi:hypothetical protein
VRKAIGELEKQGAVIEEISLPYTEYAVAVIISLPRRKRARIWPAMTECATVIASTPETYWILICSAAPRVSAQK